MRRENNVLPFAIYEKVELFFEVIVHKACKRVKKNNTDTYLVGTLMLYNGRERGAHETREI